MKRVISLAVLCVLILCSCKAGGKGQETARFEQEQICGVWITYSEVNKMLESGYEAAFGEAIKNCKEIGVTDIFLHTVPFCNAIYKSGYYPLNEKAKPYSFDILEYSVDMCHKSGIRLHAWINPYRVNSASSDVNELPADSIAYIWTHDESPENDKNVSVFEGIYLNPAESEVRAHIIGAVREIALNYEVDGIHFDDYFYPTTDENFDKPSYEQYKSESENPLSLADFRRSNVNALISGAYTAIKFIDKDITFSVSPAASIQRDFEEYYADVKEWCKSGCVDLLIPQLYFGFNYPSEEFRFENLLSVWEDAVKETETKLAVGLAAYKIGTDSENDREDFADVNTIPNEVKLCKETGDVCGVVFFSYTALFSEDPLNTQVRQMLDARH